MYAIFKINMYLFMKFYSADRTKEDFAKKLTQEYDNLIKRGGELLSKVPVAKGNTQLMETLLNLALLRQSLTTEDIIMDGIGEAIQGYWVGTTLQNTPVPPVPAPGSFQNQSLNNSFVTNIGEWTPGKTTPSTSPLPFINQLVQKIQMHLLTVQGQHLTTSLYPGFPQTPPAPGVLPWAGYMIPPVPFMFPFFERNEDETTTTALDGEEKVDGQTLKERLDKKVKEIEEAEEQLLQEVQTFVEARPTPKTVKTAEALRREIMKKMQDLRCCDC